jgi:HPt (histidine-containing phosphotransfer) domain-containing protein
MITGNDNSAATGLPPVDPCALATLGTEDECRLRAYFRGREALLQRVVGLFSESYPRKLAVVRQALNDGDWVAARSMAHQLAGDLGTLQAERQSLTARRLQQACDQRLPVEARCLCEQLATHVRPLVTHLESIARNASPEAAP